MSTQETTTTRSSSLTTDTGYIRTPKGILYIIEMVLCIVTFSMAVSIYRVRGGAVEYIQFATGSGFLLALIYFLVNLFMPNIPRYKPHGTLIELILCVVWFFLLLSAGINAAANAHLLTILAVIAVFSFLVAIAFGVSCFFLFKDWRSQGGSIPVFTTTTTTTRTTTVQT